jgi:hypothetical protein
VDGGGDFGGECVVFGHYGLEDGSKNGMEVEAAWAWRGIAWLGRRNTRDICMYQSNSEVLL